MMSVFNGIREEHLDILREVGNIGAGHSASALALLLNRKSKWKCRLSS
ncbi:chemotaxis protein CheC [Bacillus licheniformis]|nr:chemotaxis protein CheC [Bacillus licheniformis]